MNEQEIRYALAKQVPAQRPCKPGYDQFGFRLDASIIGWSES